MRFRFNPDILDAIDEACPALKFGRRQTAATWMVEQGIDKAKRAGDTYKLNAALPLYRVKNGDPTSKSLRMAFQLADEDEEYLQFLAIVNGCDAKTVALSFIIDFLAENNNI